VSRVTGGEEDYQKRKFKGGKCVWWRPIPNSLQRRKATPRKDGKKVTTKILNSSALKSRGENISEAEKRTAAEERLQGEGGRKPTGFGCGDTLFWWGSRRKRMCKGRGR